jgi:hypothetical protein
MNKLQSEGFSQFQLANILSYERLNEDLAELMLVLLKKEKKISLVSGQVF